MHPRFNMKLWKGGWTMRSVSEVSAKYSDESYITIGRICQIGFEFTRHHTEYALRSVYACGLFQLPMRVSADEHI